MKYTDLVYLTEAVETIADRTDSCFTEVIAELTGTCWDEETAFEILNFQQTGY